jgi:hypothetical protein
MIPKRIKVYCQLLKIVFTSSAAAAVPKILKVRRLNFDDVSCEFTMSSSREAHTH